MGNVTLASGIWTPDEDDNLDPEVWSATMAESIEQGIGIRVTAQEQAIGLKASAAGLTRVKYESNIIAPYEILDNGTGCFTQGMTLSGGVATVSVAGMYFITAAAALDSWGGGGDSAINQNRTIAIQIRRNGAQLAGCEVGASELYWETAQANTVVLCVPGDTISVTWYSASPAGADPDPTAGGIISENEAMNSLSIVLITPVAVA